MRFLCTTKTEYLFKVEILSVLLKNAHTQDTRSPQELILPVTVLGVHTLGTNPQLITT